MINRILGITGLLLGIAALTTASLYPARVLLNASIASSSLILLVIFFLIHFEAFKAFSKKRSTQLGLNSILMIALFIFIAVVFNLAARQYYLRFDLSEMSEYSLSLQTKEVVAALDEEVKITVFGMERSPTFRKAGDLLEGYKYLNRKVLISVVDLDREPLMADNFGVKDYDSIVVEGKGEPVIVKGISEENITNAIIRATRETSRKIYFIKGHGEKDISDKGRRGFSTVYEKLVSIGYDLKSLTLFTVDSVPDDADVIVIAGPQERFSEEDSKKVSEYLYGGGRLMVMLDPGFDASGISGLGGIWFDDSLVIDPTSNLGGRDEKIPLVSEYPETPVTENFTLSTIFPGVSALNVSGEKNYQNFIFVKSSYGSRLLRNGEVAGTGGGYALAAAAGQSDGNNAFVIIGDSDFASNAFFDVAGNGNLFLNCINWIAAEEDLISIAPRKDEFIPLYLTPGQGKVIMYVSVAGIPLSVFGLGLVIWWRRRRF